MLAKKFLAQFIKSFCRNTGWFIIIHLIKNYDSLNVNKDRKKKFQHNTKEISKYRYKSSKNNIFSINKVFHFKFNIICLELNSFIY